MSRIEKLLAEIGNGETISAQADESHGLLLSPVTDEVVPISVEASPHHAFAERNTFLPVWLNCVLV
jgi:hypothetical protein